MCCIIISYSKRNPFSRQTTLRGSLPFFSAATYYFKYILFKNPIFMHGLNSLFPLPLAYYPFIDFVNKIGSYSGSEEYSLVFTSLQYYRGRRSNSFCQSNFDDLTRKFSFFSNCNGLRLQRE